MQEPAQVKNAYQNFMRMLHPDKLQRFGDNDKIYLSTQICSAINDAYRLFTKEGPVIDLDLAWISLKS